MKLGNRRAIEVEELELAGTCVGRASFRIVDLAGGDDEQGRREPLEEL
jgi:hypothetical protein